MFENMNERKAKLEAEKAAMDMLTDAMLSVLEGKDKVALQILVQTEKVSNACNRIVEALKPDKLDAYTDQQLDDTLEYLKLVESGIITYAEQQGM